MIESAYKKLAAAIGKPIDRADQSHLWRAGRLYTYSPVFGAYVESQITPTIKPGESLAAVENDLAGVVVLLDQ